MSPRLQQQKNGVRHCLHAQQFDRAQLDRLCRLADTLRASTKTKEGGAFVASLLSHIRAMLYFAQPSTRTFLSFLNACHILGIRTCETRDPKTSSEMKGESFEDTIRTFASYVHMIVLRHPEAGSAEKAAQIVDRSGHPISIINAGSGKNQHPTQALLDIYTLQRGLKKIEGKHIVMVGDLKRGRTVRSLSYMMKNYPRVRLTYVSPPEFRMEQDVLKFLDQHKIPYQESQDFETALPEADAFYMTRMQNEHDVAGESQRVDFSRFQLGVRHLKKIKPTAVILDPLPRRGEIEIGVDEDSRALYWEQERNGLWIRAALIASLFHAEDSILKGPR